jgi:hypothetical protein
MGEENVSISWLAPIWERSYIFALIACIMWEGEMHRDLAPTEGIL